MAEPQRRSPPPELERHDEDLVGDRHSLLAIGMAAVFFACVVFGGLRLGVQLWTHHPTPWWGNAIGALAISIVHFWYRASPERRSSLAVHGTALIASVALIIPAAYGLTSSKWWLALVGFSVLLMGRRREAYIWSIATLVLMPLTATLEGFVHVRNAAPEPVGERAMAGFFFMVLLLGVTGAFRRVAHQRARELAETAASLARANRVKSRFLANMSHEVRTPLHGVIAMTDLAGVGDASPEVRGQILAAQQSARVLLRLLNDILDVTRAESDALEIESRPFDLHQALADVTRPLAAQARAKGLAFEARAAAGIVRLRKGDVVRLSQIVLNLVSNAMKFTAKGSIRLELSAAPEDSDRLLIRVIDTGVGIAADKQSHIFEPFAVWAAMSR
jgi:signal transduction histidine kinase